MKTHAYKILLVFASALAATFLNGCASQSDPQETLSRIVFPNQWVGNIDKIKFNEPSGICWHAKRETLFLAGDEGDLCEITPEGDLVKQKHIRPGDFEGITHDPATGLLYVAVEEAESILEIDPETFAIRREFTIPRTFNGKTLLKAGGEGFEAITFVPDSAHPEGGVFHVGNQAFTLTDEEDISAIFQVELPLRSGAGEAKITGYFAPGIIDISGLHYDPKTDRICVVSDATNILLEYSRHYDLLRVYAFPGDNQEGITVDGDDYIYIAQDTGGIIKLKWLR